MHCVLNLQRKVKKLLTPSDKIIDIIQIKQHWILYWLTAEINEKSSLSWLYSLGHHILAHANNSLITGPFISRFSIKGHLTAVINIGKPNNKGLNKSYYR